MSTVKFSNNQSGAGTPGGGAPVRKHGAALAAREMEAWANDGMEANRAGCDRSSGQLSDNVTEQRMLRARLCELSRERHKLITQRDYEKRVFLEKMQRKSSVFREVLKDVDLKRRSSFHAGTGSGGHLNARLALLARLDASKSLDRPREVLREGGERGLGADESGDAVSALPESRVHRSSQRPQTVPTRQGRAAASASLEPTEKSVVFSTQPMIRKSYPASNNATAVKHTADEKWKLPTTPTPSTVRFRDSNDNPGKSLSRLGHRNLSFTDAMRMNSLQSWASKGSHVSRVTSGSSRQRDGPLADPRYQALETCLDKAAARDELVDVTAMVDKMEALHKPTRRYKDKKPRLTAKIKRFMAENGITF